MRKKKLLIISLLIVLCLSFVGCGSFQNLSSKGGVFESKGDYIVINYSGGEIFDIWKLKNAYVQSSDGSDGYEFTDSNGDFITVSGDVLVIRCNSAAKWDNYSEYHKIDNKVTE